MFLHPPAEFKATRLARARYSGTPGEGARLPSRNDARPAVVEQVAGLSPPVDETALVEVTVDRLQDRHAAGGLVHGQALRGRELERVRQLAGDYGRPLPDQSR